MKPLCEVWGEAHRRERQGQESYVIACVLYHILGWPIGG